MGLAKFGGLKGDDKSRHILELVVEKLGRMVVKDDDERGWIGLDK
jgi:hypothetical protein